MVRLSCFFIVSHLNRQEAAEGLPYGDSLITFIIRPYTNVGRINRSKAESYGW